MLVQSGVPIQVVKELLGHKDLRMTVRYAHLAPENLRSAVNVLDENEKRLQYGYSG
jgi:site-specific recombinase XerD